MADDIPTRQGLVDLAFEDCMKLDMRLRSQIVTAIRSEISNLNGNAHRTTWRSWFPTNYDLHVMISRIASRDRGDGWKYFPAYGQPRRYVSIDRIRFLIQRAQRGTISADETAKLLKMRADLSDALDHWYGKHEIARERTETLTHLLCLVDTTKMDLEAAIQVDLMQQSVAEPGTAD